MASIMRSGARVSEVGTLAERAARAASGFAKLGIGAGDEREGGLGKDDVRHHELGSAIAQRVERLARREFEGPVMTLKSGRRVRSWPSPPFRILYTRDEDVLVVLRVYHQARPPLDD